MTLSDGEYANCDAHALAQLVRNGETTAEELVQTAYALIARLNPKLNAFCSLQQEEVARDLRSGLPEGPFTGVPMAMKDCVGYVQGVPRSFGCRLARDLPIDEESECVRRYRRAGFCFVGTTTVPELCYSLTTESLLYGPTHNPWRHGYSVGGSSGGAACAVAAGIVPVAYANDGAGSIRIPASSCGVFGLRPSRGRIPTGPTEGDFWYGLMTHHVITRTVRDSAAILDASDGLDAGAPYSAPAKERPYVQELGRPIKGLRVAYSTRAPNGVEVSADCQRAVEQTVALLRDGGCQVEEAAPAYDGAALLRDVTTTIEISLASSLAGIAKYMGRTVSEQTVERAHLALAERGARRTALELNGILRSFGWLCRTLGAFFCNYDVLLTPTLATAPPPHGHIDTNSGDVEEYVARLWRFSPFTPLANVAGLPAMTVPMHWNDAGLPIGVMFTAPYGTETTLFRLAAHLEAVAPWVTRRPPTSAWTST